MNTSVARDLREVAQSGELMEVGRRAVEDALILLRDDRVSVVRNNGFAVRERNGDPSDVIRMSTEMGVRTALRAIASELEAHS